MAFYRELLRQVKFYILTFIAKDINYFFYDQLQMHQMPFFTFLLHTFSGFSAIGCLHSSCMRSMLVAL